jgi:tRNA(adenine34) deaminase
MNNPPRSHTIITNPNDTADDRKFMTHALDLAKKAAILGEVPVGAVVVVDGKIIGEGWNLRETNRCALEHAEIMAIKAASQKLNAWRLIGAKLYVTLEPCLMCAGAIYQARIPNVIYGATDPKGGACGSLYKIHEDTRLNHRFLVQKDFMTKECAEILTDFFRQRRLSTTTKNSNDNEPAE